MGEYHSSNNQVPKASDLAPEPAGGLGQPSLRTPILSQVYLESCMDFSRVPQPSVCEHTASMQEELTVQPLEGTPLGAAQTHDP